MEKWVKLELADLRVKAPHLAPPPRRSPSQLPFAALSPSEFEWVVALLLSQSNSPVLHMYGRNGQTQHGIDIYEETSTGQKVIYQVKRYQRISPAHLVEAVKTYADSTSRTRDAPDAHLMADAFVLVTSAEVDSDRRNVDAITGLRDEYRRTLDVSVWGAERLSLKLREYPAVVEAAFGPQWAELFCGRERAKRARTASRQAKRFDSAVRDLVAVQFARDNEIRFRQVDLSGVTVDSMFIDVPATSTPNSVAQALIQSLSPPRPGPRGAHARMAGAAQILLHPKWSGNAVVVGGPGQGKTTLLQYVTQFHRARLLGKDSYLAETADLKPITHVDRVPIKIDLPVYAEWRKRQEAELQEPVTTGRPKRRQRRSTIEFYVCSLVSEQSDSTFGIETLARFLAKTPLLLALDGLDEVANPKAREAIADEVREAAVRFTGAGVDVRILVATRPGLVGRPLWRDAEFQTLFLKQLTSPLRMKYLEKWVQQARLDEREIRELRQAFTKNITVPHVAELAGNPMQLAILLHLMQRRSVLPQKRTTLYERYIDIFFDREAKAQIVSDNRDTLVAFHKLLAWEIHTAVEDGRSTGTVHLNELKRLLTEYLTPRGLEADFVDTLFASVTDRVLCLVQRDLDSEEFAFEVQPLREFFAAQFIYDRAPSDSTKNTRSACIAALVTRPYWQNVLRFLAGNLGSGEVPGLPYALRQILDDPKVGYHPLPRDVAKILLDDLVFSGQLELAVSDMVALILRDQGVYLLSDGLLSSARNDLTFADTRARRQAISQLRDRVVKSRTLAELRCVSQLLSDMGVDDVPSLWREARGQVPELLWIEGIFLLGDLTSLSSLPAPDLELMLCTLPESRIVTPLVERLRLSCRSPGLQERVWKELTGGRADAHSAQHSTHPHSLLALSSNERFLGSEPSQTDLGVLASACDRPHDPDPAAKEQRLEVVKARLCEYVSAPMPTSTPDIDREMARYAQIWGMDCWPLRGELIASAIEGRRPAAGDGTITSGSDVPAMQRWLAEAREYGSELQWWVLECDRLPADDELAAMTFVVSAMAFASSSVIRWTQRELMFQLSQISGDPFATVSSFTARLMHGSPRLRQPLNVSISLDRADPNAARLAILLWLTGNALTRKHLDSYIVPHLLHMWPLAGAVPDVLRQVLSATNLKMSVSLFRGSREVLPPTSLSSSRISNVLMSEAEEILTSPDSWPADVTRLAADRIGSRLAGQMSVADIASRDRWGI